MLKRFRGKYEEQSLVNNVWNDQKVRQVDVALI